MNSVGLNKGQRLVALIIAVVTAGVLLLTHPYYGYKLALILIPGLMILVRVDLGVLLLAGLFPFVNNELILFMVLGVALAFMFRFFIIGDIKLNPSHQDLPMLLFVIIITVATFTSFNVGGSIRDFALYISSIIALYMIANTVKTKEGLYRLLTILILGAVIASLVGIVQYFVGVEPEGTWWDSSTNPELSTRVFSVFGNPNIFAEYLVMTIPFGVIMTIGSKSRLKKIMFGLFTLTMVVALVLSFSRGGWIGLMVGGFFLIYNLDRKNLVKYLILGVIALLIVALMAPSVVVNRFATAFDLSDSSNSYRFILIQEGLEIMKDYWVAGIGLGHKTFMDIYPAYMLTRDKRPYHVHNTYLQFGIETGVIGLAVLLWLIFRTIKISAKIDTRDRFIKLVSVAAVVSLMSILTHGMVETMLYMPKIIFTFFLILSIVRIIEVIDRDNGLGINNRPGEGA